MGWDGTEKYVPWTSLANEVKTCFLDLEKAYDRIPRNELRLELLQHGVDGQLS